MNLQKEFRSLILPVLRGMPILVGFCVVAFLGMKRAVFYMQVQYQSSGSIKIDMRDYGVNTFNLYGPMSGGMNNFLTEVEIIKSRNVKERAFKMLPDFYASYFRKGKAKTVELWGERPFHLLYDVHDEAVLDKAHRLVYLGDNKFQWLSAVGNSLDEIEAGKTYHTPELTLTLVLRDTFLAKKPYALRPGDTFIFTPHSLEQLMHDVNANNLFIKPMDKEIFIVKVYYQHEIPEKAQRLVNALMQAYVEDDLANKNKQATYTIDFIEAELDTVFSQLKNAEIALANYKREQKIINPLLETDAVIKELAALDERKIEFDLQALELNNIYTFLQTEKEISDFSPDYQALKDATIKDNFQNLKILEAQQKDLLQRYTETSAEVLGMQEKINDLKRFLTKSVKNKLLNLEALQREINNGIAQAQTEYSTLPERERQLVVLQRNLNTIEQNYLFLVEKKTEVSVANAANYSFHEIVEYADLPEKPIAPNKSLLYGVAIFFALLGSLLVIYVRWFFIAKVTDSVEVGEKLTFPLLASIPKVRKTDDNNLEPLLNLYTNLTLLLPPVSGRGRVVTFCSTSPKEGKTFATTHLAKILANYGKKVLVIDTNLHRPDAHRFFALPNAEGIAAYLRGELTAAEAVLKTRFDHLDVLPAGVMASLTSEIIFSPRSLQLIEDLRADYDYILIDTPPLAKVADAVPLMHLSDANLWLVRAGYTRTRRLGFIPQFAHAYQIPRLHILLNATKARRSTYSAKVSWIEALVNR